MHQNPNGIKMVVDGTLWHLHTVPYTQTKPIMLRFFDTKNVDLESTQPQEGVNCGVRFSQYAGKQWVDKKRNTSYLHIRCQSQSFFLVLFPLFFLLLFRNITLTSFFFFKITFSVFFGLFWGNEMKIAIINRHRITNYQPTTE